MVAYTVTYLDAFLLHLFNLFYSLFFIPNTLRYTIPQRFWNQGRLNIQLTLGDVISSFLCQNKLIQLVVLKYCHENKIYHRLEVVFAGVMGNSVELLFKQCYSLLKGFAWSKQNSYWWSLHPRQWRQHWSQHHNCLFVFHPLENIFPLF